MVNTFHRSYEAILNDRLDNIHYKTNYILSYTIR